MMVLSDWCVCVGFVVGVDVLVVEVGSLVSLENDIGVVLVGLVIYVISKSRIDMSGYSCCVRKGE